MFNSNKKNAYEVYFHAADLKNIHNIKEHLEEDKLKELLSKYKDAEIAKKVRQQELIYPLQKIEQGEVEVE